MQKLVDDIDKRISLIDITKVPAPSTKVQEGDIVFGVLPIKLRQRYVVAVEMMRELQIVCRTAHKVIEPAISLMTIQPKDEKLVFDHLFAHERVEFVWSAFEHGVREEFHKAVLAKRIGVRVGWLAVAPTGSYPTFEALDLRIRLNIH